jgi:hypothetical protein
VNADQQLAAIARLDASFKGAGVAYWLFGGWAVDFHVGRVTREHADIDIAVWQSDVAQVGSLLANDGWIDVSPPDSDGYNSYERGAIRLDVAVLARDSDGIVYTPLLAGRGEWPVASFGADVRNLAATTAHVVRRASLIADKSEVRDDEAAAAKDAADIAVLSR